MKNESILKIVEILLKLYFDISGRHIGTFINKHRGNQHLE